jgi:hypothetical protein
MRVEMDSTKTWYDDSEKSARGGGFSTISLCFAIKGHKDTWFADRRAFTKFKYPWLRNSVIHGLQLKREHVDSGKKENPKIGRSTKISSSLASIYLSF